VIINKDVILQKEWMNKLPNNWVASCISEKVFVIIIQNKWEEVERCYYGNNSHVAIREQHLLDIEIREA